MNFLKSIKWRLLVWQTVLLAGVLVTLLTLHYQFYKRDLIGAVDAELQEGLMAVMPIIAPPQAPPGRRPQQQPNRPQQPPAHLMKQNKEQLAEETLAQLEERNIYILCQRPTEIKQYGNVPASLISEIPDSPSKPVQITRAGNRELIHPQQRILIVIGKSLDDVNAEMTTVLGTLLLIGGAVLIISVVIGTIIVTRSLRPIQTISQTAETIACGEHHRRIELADAPDELASLAQTLNESFDHLDEAIETQKRFSADASHELRTPIAVVIAQTEAALKRDRTVEEYQGVLNACLRAGKRMKVMAESLLELTRLDSRGNVLSKTKCNLTDVVSDAVNSGSLLSEKHPVIFQGLETGNAGLQVHIDRERIHQVLTNLIANAVQHNPDGCEICVSLTKDGSITVSDNGIGIPKEHLPHIFERFYRVDASRSREQGGAGLGLSIVKSLIEAHDGSIAANSEPGSSATFTIYLAAINPT